MPRHQNSFACGVDVPELTVEKRVRRAGRPNANGGNKVQKHPGKVSINPSVRMHDPGAFSEDERWSDAGCASEETTASETPGGKRDDTSAPGNAQAEMDHWDVVSQGKAKEDEWPSLKKSCDPELRDYELFETMSQVSDMTLGSWVDVEDCDSPGRALTALTLAEQRAAASTWASRIGPSNGLPKPKTALPWAGKLRPTPEEKPCQSPDDDLEQQGRRSWNKWQKSSRNLKEAKPKVAKPTPKPKEEKPPQAMTVTVTRFSTWEEEEPQRIRLDLMSNSKVSELRSKLAELCVLDDKEVRKMKLIKRKKAGFLTAQETENVSNEIFVHHIDKWPSA